jgi:hypothetical protein
MLWSRTANGQIALIEIVNHFVASTEIELEGVVVWPTPQLVIGAADQQVFAASDRAGGGW